MVELTLLRSLLTEEAPGRASGPTRAVTVVFDGAQVVDTICVGFAPTPHSGIMSFCSSLAHAEELGPSLDHVGTLAHLCTPGIAVCASCVLVCPRAIVMPVEGVCYMFRSVSH